MSLFLDCSGLACPQPVLTTKRAIESDGPQSIQVVVDNQAALENVTRFLSSNGYAPSDGSPEAIPEGKWLIRAEKEAKNSAVAMDTAQSSQIKPSSPRTASSGAGSEGRDSPEKASGESGAGVKASSAEGGVSGALGEPKTLVLMLSPAMGTGSDELGSRLMKNFLATLPEMGDALWRIVMLNGAVTLATDTSHVITELKALEDAGVDILVCGTCLEHYDVLSQKAVGQTTNMLDVVTSLQLADKVIRV